MVFRGERIINDIARLYDDITKCVLFQVIVEAAHLPLSIIIVGVGRANFAAMDELDGDMVRLSYNGKYASRDIVQFVPYRDSHTWMASIKPDPASQWYSGYESTGKVAKIRLAQEVLAEIPEQITSFMKSQTIIPGGRTKTDKSPAVASTSATAKRTAAAVEGDASGKVS